jgi:hypothetical protein
LWEKRIQGECESDEQECSEIDKKHAKMISEEVLGFSGSPEPDITFWIPWWEMWAGETF